MKKGKKLYEGKAKVIFASSDKNLVIQHFKDDATAFNNQKKANIEGKGILNNRISEHILSALKDATSVVHLNYQKSIIIATYMLCGFANFASIGIQIGGIGALEPKQRKNLSKFGFKALIGGTLASLLSATIAGMIIG